MALVIADLALQPIVGDAGVILEVRARGGAIGRGEAVTRPGFAGPLAALLAAAEGLAAGLVGRALATADEVAGLSAELGPALPSPLRFAVETALLDLLGQAQGRPIAALLCEGRAPAAAIARNALAADPVEAAMFKEAGFTAIKVKARGPWPGELARLRAIRAAVGDAVALRVDCNGSMPAADAGALLRALRELDLEYVEEPARGLALAAWPALAAAGPALAIDESAVDEAAWRAAIELPAAAIVVIKPAFVGGLFAARRRIAEARARGLAVVITSALEGAIGVAAAAHLALATHVTRAAGISARRGPPTPAWLAADLPTIREPLAAGLGCEEALGDGSREVDADEARARAAGQGGVEGPA